MVSSYSRETRMSQLDQTIPGLKLCYLVDAPQHVETLASWSFDEWGHYFPGETLAGFIRDYQGYLARDSIPLAIVAQIGEQAAGAACLFNNDSLPGFDHLTPWLAAVYVAGEFRRRGIGRLLVSRIVSEARRLGHKAIYLWTGSEARWYERQGWRRIAATVFDDQHIDVMQLDLDSDYQLQ